MSFLTEKIDLINEIKHLNKYENAIFFDILEIFNNLSIEFLNEIGEKIDQLNNSPENKELLETNTNKIYRILNFSEDAKGLEEFFNYKLGNNIYIENIGLDYDFIYKESAQNHFIFINMIDFQNNNLPFSSVILYFLKIIQCKLKNNGMFLLKLENFKKKIHYELAYILSNIFDKVWLCKPVTNAFHKKEKYLFCKGFKNKKLLVKDTQKKDMFENPFPLKSILGEKDILPYYFVNKLNELEVILGQSNLEAIQEIINFYINNNVLEKLETIKRNNLQKCLQILSKHNIPITNNLYKKNNIFLESSNSLSTA